MQKLTLMTLLAIALGSFSGINAAGVISGMASHDKALADNKGQTVKLKFYSDRCPHCVKLTQNAQPKGNVYNVDTARPENREVAQKYGVRGLPTVVTISGDGTTKSSIGYIDAKNALEA